MHVVPACRNVDLRPSFFVRRCSERADAKLDIGKPPAAPLLDQVDRHTMLRWPRCEHAHRAFELCVHFIRRGRVHGPRVSALDVRSGHIELDPVQRARTGPHIGPDAAAADRRALLVAHVDRRAGE